MVGQDIAVGERFFTVLAVGVRYRVVVMLLQRLLGDVALVAGDTLILRGSRGLRWSMSNLRVVGPFGCCIFIMTSLYMLLT